MKEDILDKDISTSQQSFKQKLKGFGEKLDLFSYVPEPNSYPVSTKKSKIGSILFLLIVLGYLIFDFIKFMTENFPVINTYQKNIPLNHQYTAPEIAFGFVYGEFLNLTLNDPTYFSYSFITINSFQNQNNQTIENKVAQPLNLCSPAWLGEFSNIYRNLTCPSSGLTLMNVVSQDPTYIIQRLVLNSCQPNQNISCKTTKQLFSMTSGGRFFLLINMPSGFDYKNGEIDNTQSSVQIYQFFLVPNFYIRINIDYYNFQFITYPTYLTTWNYKKFEFMQSYEPVEHFSNVSVFNPYLLMSVTFDLYPGLTEVQVQYQTLLQRLSNWGALVNLIMSSFALFCLAYNKKKFEKLNPSWKNFEKIFKEEEKKKIQIQMTSNIGENTRREQFLEVSQNEQQDSGGILALRRKVQASQQK